MGRIETWAAVAAVCVSVVVAGALNRYKPGALTGDGGMWMVDGLTGDVLVCRQSRYGLDAPTPWGCLTASDQLRIEAARRAAPPQTEKTAAELLKEADDAATAN